MKKATVCLYLLLFQSSILPAATVRYVDAGNSTPSAPYISWSTAAVAIQDAVDVSGAGDEVVVTNGTYSVGGRAPENPPSGRVAVMVPLQLRSVNGPQLTIIDGTALVRCIYLTNGASLSGFTLTNGKTGNNNIGGDGGGVLCESTNALVSNCVIVSNTVDGDGGGAYRGTLSNCTLIGNSSPGWPENAGGAEGAVLEHCTFIGNRTYSEGGGAYRCALNNCVLIGNIASSGSTPPIAPHPITSYGNGGGASTSTLNNCLLIGNAAAWAGGAVINCYLTNCTMVSNNTSAAWSSTLYNCISYFNPGGNYSGGTMNFCCTTPDPGGIGNIASDPLFVDLAGGNLRLQSNSPCINAGNNSYVTTSTDLDGNPRIVNGTVDMGAYEYGSVPVLRIAVTGGKVILSWPVWASNYFLEEAGALSGAWATNYSPVIVTNNENEVTVLAGSTMRFYRLLSPK